MRLDCFVNAPVGSSAPSSGVGVVLTWDEDPNPDWLAVTAYRPGQPTVTTPLAPETSATALARVLDGLLRDP